MIRLRHGTKQRFRHRHGDINLIGDTHLGSPIVQSEYSLNGGQPVHFYVEPEPPNGRQNGLGARTEAMIRLSDTPGSFNIEIPVDAPSLREGTNLIEIRVRRAREETETVHAEFHWDSRPVPLPMSVTDLSSYTSIQEIGQIVDGNFELDRDRHVIRTVEPVGADALFLLGSPNTNQEATYEVSFGGMEGVFLGLSDFFVRHEPLAPELGIKPGYSSAGLATIRPSRRAEAWLLNGALLDEDDVEPNWTLSSFVPVRAPIAPGTTYNVRHQVMFAEGVNLVRFRIWPKGEREPERWLCEEHDTDLGSHLPRFTHGSFGLFQYGGRPTEWSNIHVRAIDVEHSLLELLRKKKTLLRRKLRAARRAALVEQRAFRFAAQLKARLLFLVIGVDFVLEAACV